MSSFIHQHAHLVKCYVFIFLLHMWAVFRSVMVGECSSGDIAIFIILSRKNKKMVLEHLLVFI